MNRGFREKDTQMPFEPRKISSTLLKIREIEIKVPQDAVCHLSDQQKSKSDNAWGEARRTGWRHTDQDPADP